MFYRWWCIIRKCIQNRPGRNLKGYMNSVIIIKIITLHLHSTLQQNEFQSNLPNIFTKDHLAESQRVSSVMGPCSCSQSVSRCQRAGLLSCAGETCLWEVARKLGYPFSKDAWSYSIVGICLPQEMLPFLRNNMGEGFLDFLKQASYPA